jgi:drug/metabolite transporter (DMT)-like permease
LIAVAAFYGTNFGCVKVLNDSLEPSVSAFSRFTLASLVFLPYVAKTFRVNPALVLGGLEVGAYNALGYFFQSLSLETTSASTVAFICSLAVVVVPLIDLVFPHGDRKKDQKWYTPLLPALLAAAGVGSLELGGTDVPGVGDLLALGQPVFFGYAFYRIETMMRNCKEPGDAQAFTGSMMISVALGSLAWTLHDFILPHLGATHTDTAQLWSSVQEQLAGMRDWKVIAAIAWTGVVTTALTAYGENYAMKSLSAAESTVIYSTEPLWGTAFAAVALGEHVGLNTFVGAALILSACVWSSVGPTLSIAGMASTVQIAMMQNLDELVEKFGANWQELMEKLMVFQGVGDSIPPEL